MEYILFVFRDANFEPVTMLAPYYQYKHNKSYLDVKKHTDVVGDGDLHINVFNRHYVKRHTTNNGYLCIPVDITDACVYLNNLQRDGRDGCKHILDWLEPDSLEYKQVHDEFYLKKYKDHIFDVAGYLSYRCAFDPIMCYKQLKDIIEIDGRQIKLVDHLVVLDKIR